MAVTTEIKAITPALAMQWLESGNTHNRPVRQSTVMKYARDMATGRWKLTHQGICFDESGILIDGQHRLWAVVESNHTIKMMVTRGLSMDSQEVVDGGSNRSTADVIALRDGEPVQSLAMGIARYLTKQAGASNPSRQEQVACYDIHKDKINSTLRMFQNVRAIKNTAVMVPFMRALYSYPVERLIPAAQVLCDGMPHEPIDSVLIKLRNVILLDKPSREEIYAKTERALYAYLTNDQVKFLYAAESELFPLPNEKRKKADPKAKVHINKHMKARLVKVKAAP